MVKDLEKYLSDINFEKQLDYLKKKIKNSPVIVYGVGKLFQTIKSKYDISWLNVLAVSDASFFEEDEFLDYKAIPPDNMYNYSPEYVLVATLKYESIIDYIVVKYFKTNSTKVIPLCKPTLKSILKDFFRNIILNT